ncbi:GNAT family N-acetyltransferase [Plebeiibacterium sediminum]|uniref:GNAT family N-acetyltransferase n=1 Tax=Plebeiibacterium sediminum TaxID=2992112 RepID=A0AAE3M5C1_9BACT|nr:GNAT family N-acetyltransferase [Plebeiobacterium sediminum]MCW3787414.1 GNAT family N-acetyltransferase [Plebeiobacterium sediminum]
MNIIKTNRLLIRRIEKDDIGILLKIYNKEENMRYISSGRYDWSYAELEEKYTQINVNHKMGIGIFTVELKETNEIIGEAGLFNSFDIPNILELGYIIDVLYWNKGFGKEILNGLIDYAFHSLKTKTLIARMYANNIASVKLSETCGMTKIKEELANNNHKVFVYELKNKAYSI